MLGTGITAYPCAKKIGTSPHLKPHLAGGDTQGLLKDLYLSSGDGYNRRLDAIMSNFECKERCMDDTVHYDEDLENHWWRTIDFLTCVGQAGIVLNRDKFQFADKTVDFAGFRVSETTIEPLPKYIDTIKDLPTPVSTPDIRSWFGLVNQVTNYAQLRDTNSFEMMSLITSKQAIIDAIRHGVEIFDMQKRTCWRVEGEALAVAWGLEQTKYFTQGCNNLVVVTNHKPLVKLLGDRTLDEISNTRLFRLKQKMLLRWFTNCAADATSRHPCSVKIARASVNQVDNAYVMETAIMSSFNQQTNDSFMMPWSLVAEETAADASLLYLMISTEAEILRQWQKWWRNSFDLAGERFIVYTWLRHHRRVSKGGAFGARAPPLEPNAQRKNLRRLKNLRGQIQQKSPKFSKWIFFFFFA